ncbi:MAG: class I SAM-dependent methyltransferase [Actinobacteria bacterium]|nr:class I SAM-dependent methyltransferase [Actinomycetota bacterium]
MRTSVAYAQLAEYRAKQRGIVGCVTSQRGSGAPLRARGIRGVRSAATLRRSHQLFRAFRVEQTDPATFYNKLAADTATQLAQFHELRGAAVLDVGGGPGYFVTALADAGAFYVPLDADSGELRLHGRQPSAKTVIGDGRCLPFATDSFDITYSSNVAEHVASPWQMADEMVRVTKPGGIVYLSYTLWYGPWGGHETAPWHFLGGRRAADRYTRTHGHEPKNLYGESLFPISAASGLRWARGCDEVGLISAYPRYLPAWSWGVLRIPILREFATWNLVLVLEKK